MSLWLTTEIYLLTSTPNLQTNTNIYSSHPSILYIQKKPFLSVLHSVYDVSVLPTLHFMLALLNLSLTSINMGGRYHQKYKNCNRFKQFCPVVMAVGRRFYCSVIFVPFNHIYYLHNAGFTSNCCQNVLVNYTDVSPCFLSGPQRNPQVSAQSLHGPRIYLIYKIFLSGTQGFFVPFFFMAYLLLCAWFISDFLGIYLLYVCAFLNGPGIAVRTKMKRVLALRVLVFRILVFRTPLFIRSVVSSLYSFPNISHCNTERWSTSFPMPPELMRFCFEPVV